MPDFEKGEKGPRDSVEQQEYSQDDVLDEPPAEATLHRGLKARQISMIAVSDSIPPSAALYQF